MEPGVVALVAAALVGAPVAALAAVLVVAEVQAAVVDQEEEAPAVDLVGDLAVLEVRPSLRRVTLLPSCLTSSPSRCFDMCCMYRWTGRPWRTWTWGRPWTWRQGGGQGGGKRGGQRRAQALHAPRYVRPGLP